MESELLSRVVTELAQEFTGGIVKLVHQPDEQTLVLRVFARGRERRLIVSSRPDFNRLHITTARPLNPAVPKRFCALLRARLTGAKVITVERLPGESIVLFCFAKSRFEKSEYEQSESVENKAADLQTYTLVVELTGKSANVILIDSEGIVLDALKYFEPETSGRAVFPGLFLEPLLSKPHSPAKAKGVTVERFGDESWNEATDRVYSALVEQSVQEKERSKIRRCINKARKKSARKVKNLQADKEAALKGGEQGRFGELLLVNRANIKRGAKIIEATDYTVVPSIKVTVPLDEKLGPQENIERYFKKARKAKRALKLLETRLPETEREVERFDSMLYGLATAITGDELDAFKEELVKTGFLKAKKREKGGAKIERPKPGTDLSHEVSIISSSRSDSGGFKAMDKRARTNGVKRAASEPDAGTNKVSGAKAGRAEPFRRYTSSEGFAVLCGKSGAGNDYLVKREAVSEDIWFHAQNVPGSHVIIKVAGRAKELTRTTLEEAAGLAAFYSKAKESGLVEVIYTEAKHVKKPRGAKPGSVTVREHRSLKVRPKEMAQ